MVTSLRATQTPDAFLVTYGDTVKHRCAILDRAIAEKNAANLHGTLVALVKAPDMSAVCSWFRTPSRVAALLAFPNGSAEQALAQAMEWAEQHSQMREAA